MFVFYTSCVKGGMNNVSKLDFLIYINVHNWGEKKFLRKSDKKQEWFYPKYKCPPQGIGSTSAYKWEIQEDAVTVLTPLCWFLN